MPSSAALDYLLTNQCGLSEEFRLEFSNPLVVLFTICMTPGFMFAAAKARERRSRILQGGSFGCKVSRKMRDASYE